MILLREPMRVAMALITTMASLAAIYGILGVHFIAAFQVLIYVGAVMVFMVYVIMLMEVRETVGRRRYSQMLVPGMLMFTMMLGLLGISVWRAPSGRLDQAGAGATDFGLSGFSAAFLRDYWLPFELTTILLVAAIVAALAVVRVGRQVAITANAQLDRARDAVSGGANG